MEQSATPWRVFDAPPDGAGTNSAADSSGDARKEAPAAKADAQTTRIALAGIAGAVVIGVIAVAIAVSGSGSQIVEAPDKALSGSNDTALLAAAGTVVVDVTGAVVRPGMYHLPAGSRVGDAIDAAGGFSPRVDASRVAVALNLAETLKDGGQVRVPSRDDASVDASGGAGGSGGSAGSSGSTGAHATNLNTASESELEALPGIGPVTAAKIIESRAATPFTSVNQLLDRKLVGQKAFDQLKSLISVN